MSYLQSEIDDTDICTGDLKRLRVTDENLKGSNDSINKRRDNEKKDVKREETVVTKTGNYGISITKDILAMDDTDEFASSINTLNIQKKNSILFVQTELRMRLENANTLAAFEEKRIQQFYDDQVSELKKKLAEEQHTRTRRNITDGFQSRQHRTLNHKFDTTIHTEVTGPSSIQAKRDHPSLTVQLTEEEMVDDLIVMAHEWSDVCLSNNIQMPCIAAPLSYNRLLLNDRVIYPNTPCVLMSNGTKMYDCMFVATVVKEKEGKEKKKDPEFVLKVSATRKRRFPIDLLRSGEMVLVFKEEDIQVKDSHGANNIISEEHLDDSASDLE